MEVGLQDNYKLSAKSFTILYFNRDMKINRLNNMLRFIVVLLFLNSCLNENALIDPVSDNEVLLIINDESVTSKNFKKVYLVDLSKHNLKLASKIASELNINHSLIEKSLFALNKKVDCFFSVGVFGQQYPFDKKVIKKIYTLLKKDGVGIFSIKLHDEYNIEPLSLDEDLIFNFLKPYKHKIEKESFPTFDDRVDDFLIVSLFRDS